MTSTYYAVADSPIGPLTVVGDGDAVTGLYMTVHRHRPPLPDEAVCDPAALADPVRQLGEWFRRERRDFELDVSAAGTPFQEAVWAALRELPYGETTGYGELAARLGRPDAARAVGLANGRNPVSIVVPCHRVVGASGAMTGYGGGVERKRWLLAHERGEAVVSVTTTGVYCRPSCSARPAPEHVTFHASAAEARVAGFRACKRCRFDD